MHLISRRRSIINGAGDTPAKDHRRGGAGHAQPLAAVISTAFGRDPLQDFYHRREAGHALNRLARNGCRMRPAAGLLSPVQKTERPKGE
eukprot:7317463-Pyramimonas_sp.AAC.1